MQPHVETLPRIATAPSTATVDRFAWERAVRDDSTLGGADMPARTVKAVALTLATYARSGEAWVHLGTLAEKLETSARTVRKALARLRDRGYLAVDVNGGPGDANRFFLHVPLPPCPEGSFRTPPEASFRQNRALGTGNEQGVPPGTQKRTADAAARQTIATAPQEPAMTPPSPAATRATTTIATMEPRLFDAPASVRPAPRPKRTAEPKRIDDYWVEIRRAFAAPGPTEGIAWGQRKNLRNALIGREIPAEALPRLIDACKRLHPGWSAPPTPAQIVADLDRLVPMLAADESARRRSDAFVAAARPVRSWDDIPSRDGVGWTDEEIAHVCAVAPHADGLVEWARPRKPQMTVAQVDAVRAAIGRLEADGLGDAPGGDSLWVAPSPHPVA